jgi:predicted RNA-binding Zn-ribbon protein involved in translation (DUF1610 family)
MNRSDVNRARASVACPNTDAVVEFEAPCTEAGLWSIWNSTFQVECPACGDLHAIRCAAAYKQAVMAQFDFPVEHASILH